MKSDDLDQMLRDTLSGTAPADVHAGAQRHFDALQARLQRQPTRPSVRERHPLWWLWSGVSLAGAAAVVVLMFSLFFSPALSWSQVVERFRALPFFNATVYVSMDPAQPPEKLEIWASQDHRTRVHYRGLIVFSEGDKVVKVLRASSGEELSVETLRAASREVEGRKNLPLIDLALGLSERLGKMPHFSLDEILGTFGSNRQGLRPVPNLEANTAPDMQVFDIATPGFPDWLRLWVLKKSELPIRIRSWNPNSGEQVEAVFDYITQMPDEAFDPAKVQAAVEGKRGSANQLYALLKDPGKRPLTPEDVFAGNGYHTPEIESVGRTEDGVLWVLSRHAWNRRPDGQTHYGWGGIADDLGQKYLRSMLAGTSDPKEERTLEYYVPLGYHTDYRKPASFTLTSTDQEDYRPQGQPAIVIGKAEIKEWKEGAEVPNLHDDGRAIGPDDFIMLALREVFSREDWDRLDQLAATIPGAPEDSKLALFRDVLLALKLDHIRQPREAAAQRARLFPLVKSIEKNKSWEEMHIITGHLNDLLHAGQTATARQLANECVAALLQSDMTREIGTLVFDLHRGGMKQAAIRQFFDQDVLNLPKVKEEAQSIRLFANEDAGAANAPQFAAWRDYVAGLAKRYATQPLPSVFDFIDDAPALPAGQESTPLPLPGHEEYQVSLLSSSGGPTGIAAHVASVQRVDASQVIVSKSVVDALRPVVCVARRDADWSQIWTAYLLKNHIEAMEKAAPRQVLVAHYDGRKLPSPRDVQPLDGSILGLRLLRRQGGSGMEPNHVLNCYQETLNDTIPFGDIRRILIVNETGLSEEHRANQSYPDSYLAYECAFWSGPKADALARDWFRDNFGITFQEEVRELKTIELHTVP